MTDLSPRAAGPSSVVTYRVGGREYPMHTVRQCRVCLSPYRFDIESALITTGQSYQKIVDSLPEGHELSRRNVKDHYTRGHLPLEQAGVRRIVEARAESLGKSIEDEADSLVDGLTLAQVVVQKAFERMTNGDELPDLREGLAAAKFLADMGEYTDGGTDMAAVTEAFIAYHESAQQVMSEDQFAQFGRTLSQNPVLKALASKFDGEVVEGEVEVSG